MVANNKYFLLVTVVAVLLLCDSTSQSVKPVCKQLFFEMSCEKILAFLHRSLCFAELKTDWQKTWDWTGKHTVLLKQRKRHVHVLYILSYLLYKFGMLQLLCIMYRGTK